MLDKSVDSWKKKLLQNFLGLKIFHHTEPIGNCNHRLENSHLQTGCLQTGVVKYPVFYVLNIRGWIKLIYDKIPLIYSVKNEFNPTSEVQNIGNGAFQNTPFANALFANGSFPNSGYSCLWAENPFSPTLPD